MPATNKQNVIGHTAPTGGDLDSEHFFLDELRIIDEVNGHTRVQSIRTSVTLHLSKLAMIVLQSCVGLKSLDEHRHCAEQALINNWQTTAHKNNRRETAAQFPQTTLDEIQFEIGDTLSKFIHNGFLLPQSHLTAGLDQTINVPRSVQRIGSLSIITKNRPDALRACATSFATNRCSQGPSKIIVADDSDDASTISSNRQILDVLQARFNIEIWHLTRREKRLFAESLHAASGAPMSVIDFALFGAPDCGPTTGANRNTILLHTLGELTITADDDSICWVKKRADNDSNDSIRFSSSLDIVQASVLQTPASVLAALKPSNSTIYDSHLSLLGANLNERVAKHASVSGFLSEKLLQAILNKKGSVVITINGIAGDSGTSSPLILPEDNGGILRSKLTQSFVDYATACESREVIKCSQGLAISDNLCNSKFTIVGLDNTRLLPPFFPLGRNQDWLAGEIITKCFPNYFFGFLPEILVHSPYERKINGRADAWDELKQISLASFVSICLKVATEDAEGSTFSSLENLGSKLLSLGNLPSPEFRMQVRRQVKNYLRAWMSKIDSQLVSYDAKPDFWAQDQLTLKELLQLACENEDWDVPRELVDGRPVEQAARQAQSLIASYGELLTWWPKLLESAKTIINNGASHIPHLASAPDPSPSDLNASSNFKARDYEKDDSFPALSLLGFLSEQEAIQFLQKSCELEDQSRKALLGEWEQAKQMRGNPILRAGNPEILDIPEEFIAYIDRLKQKKHTSVLGPDWTVKLVEIAPLISIQTYIRSQVYCPPPGWRHAEMETMITISLPHDAEKPSPHFKRWSNGIFVTFDDPNTFISHHGVITSENPLTLGVKVAAKSPFVHVCRFNGRCFLNNGYHRTYAFAKAGATHIPCIFQDTDTIITAPTRFSRDLLLSDDPPTLGHFLNGRAHELRVRKFEKIINVSWSEAIVRD